MKTELPATFDETDSRRHGVPDRPELWEAIQAIVDSAFAGVALRVHDERAHTSGLFNFTGEYYSGTYVPGIPWQGQEWGGQPEPGTDWSYANTNYVLAGLLIETVTGRSNAEEMRRRILRPLGATRNRGAGHPQGITEPHARGYYRYQDAGQWKVVDTTRMNPPRCWPRCANHTRHPCRTAATAWGCGWRTRAPTATAPSTPTTAASGVGAH